jgi:hypothetical protein
MSVTPKGVKQTIAGKTINWNLADTDERGYIQCVEVRKDNMVYVDGVRYFDPFTGEYYPQGGIDAEPLPKDSDDENENEDFSAAAIGKFQGAATFTVGGSKRKMTKKRETQKETQEKSLGFYGIQTSTSVDCVNEERNSNTKDYRASLDRDSNTKDYRASLDRDLKFKENMAFYKQVREDKDGKTKTTYWEDWKQENRSEAVKEDGGGFVTIDWRSHSPNVEGSDDDNERTAYIDVMRSRYTKNIF